MSKYIRKYIILISVDLLYQFMIIMSSGISVLILFREFVIRGLVTSYRGPEL